MTKDTLTILTCTPGRRCAKLYAQSTTEPPEPYDAGFMFGVEEAPVASLQELGEALDALRGMPDRMVIRDRLRPDAKPSPNGLYTRRRVDRPNDPAPFEHAEHHAFMLDADSTAVAFDPLEPRASVEAWRRALPPALQGAGLVFQFSAKQHLSPTLRGHAWFWSKGLLGSVPLARWSRRHGFDPAVFNAVQPLYTADPLFGEGLADPLSPRALVVLEGHEAELDLLDSDWDERAGAGVVGQRLPGIALEEVCDPSPDPRAEAARAAVAKQLARAFERPGVRWDLCGAFGGACANAGVPPEECCAVLESIRADDVADHEFGAGLKWALGAYSFSARPLGLKGVREILGAITAQRLSESVGTLGRIFLEAEAEATAPVEAGELEGWGSLPIEEYDPDQEPEPIAYLCQGLNIGPGKPSAVVAYANNSKTPWALEFALHVAAPGLAGKEFQGFRIERQVKTLVLLTEGARNARRKLAKICKGHGVNPAGLRGQLSVAQGPPGFLNVEAAADLGERAVAQGVGLVVIDTYNSAFDGSKDRNTNDFSLALKVLGDISDRHDVTFLVLLHTRKGDPKHQNKMPTLQDIDGHNSIAGALQAAVGLWRLSPEDKHTIGVCCIREVDAAFDTYAVKWTDTAGVGGEGLRAELVDGESDAGDALDKERARRVALAAAEVDTVKILADLIQATGFTTMRAFREVSTGLGRPEKESLLHRLRRDGVIVMSVAGSSQQIALAKKGPATAEAFLKWGL